MKRKGFTTLFVLIISSVCLPILVFAWQSLFVQAKLNSNRVDKIQGELNLESEINRIIYDENGINDSIINIIKTKPEEIFMKDNKFTVPISSDLLSDSSVEINFPDEKNSKPKYNLNIVGKYKEITISKKLSGTICIKELDDCDNGLVYLQGGSEDYINCIENLMTIIPDSIDLNYLPAKHSLVRTSNYNDINIKATLYTNSELCLDHKNGNCIRIFDNNIILIVRSDGFNRNHVVIDSTNNPNFTTSLNGIIYIENGDLTFKGKCHYQGLVFIKDGQIKKEGDALSKISGKVVLSSFKDPRDAVEIGYEKKTYLKYAKYLPPLLDPQIIK